MKNFVCFLLSVFVIVAMLPLLIVGGPDRSDKAPGRQVKPPGTETARKAGLEVNVFITSENRISRMDFEEYVKGVVAAEMPVEFEPEALKAQAVAARTYAYARMKRIYGPRDESHNGADICTDSAHCQAWTAKADAMKKWGGDAVECWSKINDAAEATRGIIILYEGRIINPVFHSNSGGKTENSEEVWEGAGEPYLKSVFSAGEDSTSEYKSEVLLKRKDFYNALKKEYPQIKLNINDLAKEIQVLEYSEGGRVKILKAGNTNIKGTDFRRLFTLKSTNFSIKPEGKDSVRITTYGYGHGVGMSQWGANYMAKTGSSYQDIIKYYYRGVDLEAMGEYEKNAVN